MTKFSDLALDPKVLLAVSESGYEIPTPIQVQAIPHALEGRDVLGIAQTGTGKTASFVLPMITHLSKGRARARMPRSLVLAPTRELAAQVAENFEKYSKHVKLSMALLIGGVSFKDQDKLIDRGVDVLIATPGRLLDHFERGKLMLTGVQIMVVDEADRMLDMGFIPDIERIFKLVPFTRQTLFFSATMAPEITRITQEFLHNPVRVEVARQATTSETIDQYICRHTPRRRDAVDGDKREVLRRLIQAEGDTLTNGIIFCNRKRDVDVLAKSLKKHGFDAAPLHGDLDQSLRTKILGDFRDGALKLLVASDVAARGLDIPSVSHVFNFDVPIHSEDYVHRIGRTGRAGRSGKAITLCFPHEEKYLAKIEELVKKTIPVMPSPLAESEPPAAAEPEAAPRRAERSRRSEGRSEGRSESRSESRPEQAAEPRPEARVREERAEPKAAEAAPEGGRSRASESRGESRGGGRRDRGDNGRSVMGMGDHVPAFLLREFRFDPMPTTADAEDEPEVAEDVTPAPVEPRVEAPARPVPVETPVEEAAAEEAAAEVEAVPASVEAQDAPAAAPAEASEPAAPEAAETVPEAPAVEAATADAAPAKPKKPRAPRKRAPRAAKAKTEDAAPADEATPSAETAPAA